MATANSDSGFVDNWQGSKTLVECNLHMLTTEDGCDVIFRVGQKQETVRCHRYVLMSRSCVFHAMFNGPLAEKGSINVPDVKKGSFVEFIKFLYADKCSISGDSVTALLYLSKKYAIDRLQSLCLSYLEQHLSVENACVILNQTYLFDEKKLMEKTLEFITTNADAVLKTPAFRELSKPCLDKIIGSTDLDLDPKVLFKAVLSWADAECSRQGKDSSPPNKRKVLGESIYLIGFTSLDTKTFIKEVLPEKMLLESEVIKIISYMTCPDSDVKPFRAVSRINEVIMYTRSRTPNQNEVDFVKDNGVCDSLIVKCNTDLYIKSIELANTEGGVYDISIEYISESFNTVRCQSALSQSQLECDIHIRPDTECKINVIREPGDCPSELMSDLKLSYKCGKSIITFERQECPGYRTKGMVKKLFVKSSF